LARTRITPATLAARGLQPLRSRSRRWVEDLDRRQRRHLLATAAGIAATGILAWLGTDHLGWKSYETRIGVHRRIELADGSTVDLNTNTQLRARKSGNRREIMLARGEALFHVAHDPRRPFYVVAAGTVIRAVGTAFSVRIRAPEDVAVLVAEGRVAVSAPGTEANFENPTSLAAAPKVSASEAANVRRDSVSVSSLAGPDIQRRLAWTAGRIVFRGETLEDAVREFNRYNRRQITIVDPSILNVRVGASFQTTDPDSFIAALRRSFGSRAQVENDGGEVRLFAGGQPR